jgi:hypothetical protein
MRTQHREVSVKQIEFDLGREYDDASTSAVPIPPPIAETLVHLMAAAIIAVHQTTTQEIDDDDPGRE